MTYFLVAAAFLAGLLLGALFFSRIRPHTPFAPSPPKQRLSRQETAGLLAAVLARQEPALIPGVVIETDHTIGFEHPRPKHRLHYIFMPKKDIKNLGELGEEEHDQLIDLFAAIVSQINKQQLHNYKVWTNGPGKQDVSYLHFHLGAD